MKYLALSFFVFCCVCVGFTAAVIAYTGISVSLILIAATFAINGVLFCLRYKDAEAKGNE